MLIVQQCVSYTGMLEGVQTCCLYKSLPVMNFVLYWLVGWWLLLLECLKALQTFVIFGTIYQMAQCIILEDLVLE